MRLFLLVLLLVPLTGFGQNSNGDKTYLQAKELLEGGDKKKGMKILNNARAEYLKEKNYSRYFDCSQLYYVILQNDEMGEESRQVILETISAIPQNTQDLLDIHAKLQDNLAYTQSYLLNQPEDALQSYNKAIQYYEKAGKAQSPDMAMELTNRAVTQATLGDYQSAVEDLIRGIALYDKDPETTQQMRAGHYNTLGYYYGEMAQFDKALQTYNKALAYCTTPETEEMRAAIYNNIGNVYNKQGKYTSSLPQFERSLAINEKLFGRDADHYALNLINVGNALKDMGDFDGALSRYQSALDIYSKTPPTNDTDLTDLLLNLCRLTDDLGMTEESQVLLGKAEAYIHEKYGENSLEQADIYMSMAATYYNHGEYDESLNYNFKALSLMEAHHYPLSSPYAQIYNNVGQAYDELNDVPLALKYKEQALDLYQKIYGPSHSSVAMAVGNIGLSYEIAGDYGKAIEYLKKSLDIRLKVQEPTHEDIGTTYLNIGLMYLKKDDGRQGVEYLEKARPIYDGYNKHAKKAMIYNRLAAGYELMGKRDMEIKCIQQAMVANVMNFDNLNPETNPVQPDYLDYYEMVISYTAKADYYTRLGDKASLLKAIPLLDGADKVLTAKAHSLRNAQDRLELAQVNGFFTEAGLPLMDKLFKATQDQQYLQKALYFAERSKANELFADIQRSKAVSVSGVPKKLLDKRSGIQTRIATLRQQTTSAYDAGNQPLIARLKAQEFDLTKQLEAVEAEMATASPRQKWLTRSALPSWSEISGFLDANTALVSYTITDSAKYILIATKNKLAIRTIPPKTDIEKLIRGFSNQVKFQGPGLKQLTQELTNLLWTPVESALAELGSSPTHLIIVPDGPLNFLPFEALGKEQYLLTKYTIHYQLSCALMLNRAALTVRGKPSFVALAPVFEDKETNYINKSCQRFVEQAQKTDSTTRAFSLNGDYITPLPATEDEVERINQIHVDKGIFSKYFTREAAREELIKKGELAEFDYIHFATHGFVNSQYPELSGLLLTQDKNSQEDGILYSGEIAGLTLKADLVTLSACETALGKKIEGEGVRGLTTAFMAAGARSVVASLWKVADESTAQLMISFYTELLSGKDKASALRSAKKSLLDNPKYSHPYYWAAFVQIGSNATR